MLFSNLCKVGTLTALAVAIAACGSNSPDTPTNNPTTIPTAPTDNTKSDAGKTQSEKEKVDKAKIKAEKEVKPKLEVEDNIQTPSYLTTLLSSIEKGKLTDDELDEFFEPITRKQHEPWGLEIISADDSKSSLKVSYSDTTGATYKTYSYNLSDAGIVAILGQGRYKGQDVDAILYAYGGRPTNANELDTLKGEAIYTGKGYFNSNQLNMKTVIKANFNNKKVSGSITTVDRTAKELHDIQLLETDIHREKGVIMFEGEAIDRTNTHGTLRGEYGGVFMGQGAAKVVGDVSVKLPNDEREALSGVFVGSK